MKKIANEILARINSEAELLGIDDTMSLKNLLHMIHFIRPLFEELYYFIVNYKFDSEEEEIFFFKELKPRILSQLIYYNKVYRIESKCPNGSNEVMKKYLDEELDSLTYFFNRNLDLYQYYRSGSTTYDEHYFVRGKLDIRLCNDSSQFDKDAGFSTGYDYKVAKILANEMLRIYLNKRMQNIGKEKELEEGRIRYAKTPVRFTGKKVALIELGYALANSGDINGGRIEIKEMMDFLGSAFNIDLGDYYRTYITIKDRKKDRTIYLSNLIQTLIRKMDEDDAD